MPDFVVVGAAAFHREHLEDGRTRWTASSSDLGGRAVVAVEERPPDLVARVQPGWVLYVIEGGLRLDGHKTPLTPGSLLAAGNATSPVTVGPKGARWLIVDTATATSPQSPRIATASGLRRKAWTPLPGNRFMRQRVAIGAEGYPEVTFVQADILNFGRITPAAPQVLFVTGGALRINDQFCRKGGVVFVPAGAAYWPTGIADVVTYLRVGT